MVTEVQFIAIAVFLLWGLVSSLCGMLRPDADDQLWWLDGDPTGEGTDAGAAAGSASARE
jgi:hypothetical protein